MIPRKKTELNDAHLAVSEPAKHRPKHQHQHHSPAITLGKSDAASEADEAEEGLYRVEDGDKIGSTMHSRVAALGEGGGEDEVDEDGTVHEGEPQCSEDHYGVWGTEICCNQQVLFEWNGPKVCNIGEGSLDAPVNESQHAKLL